MSEILKFTPFTSCINPSFWHKFTEIKLDTDRLDDKGKNITGFFTNFNSPGNFLDVNSTSFNNQYNAEMHMHPAHGMLFNKNTIEEFKTCDKTEILNKAGEELMNNMINGNCLKDPTLLNSFIILSFADLKSYKYYYWFAFPAPSLPISFVESSCKAAEKFSSDQMDSIYHSYMGLSHQEKAHFILCEKNAQFYPVSLDTAIILNCKMNLEEYFKKYENIYFCSSDASNDIHPGWFLRNYIALLVHHCPIILDRANFILSLRLDKSKTLNNSLLYNIKFADNSGKSGGDVNDQNNWVGWERNKDRKFGPRITNIASSLDPLKLAESSVDLNLKLMKWRIVPDLNLDKVKNLKCLLLGAGTLGCAVARCLLGWGVRYISFVDSGKVSFSNPVRQSLFTNADCINGGKPKAETAAERLKEIFPGVKSKGYNLRIPMPGHTIGQSVLDVAKNDLLQLKNLIAEHDCIFLLTDSRESRWLPTLLSTYLNKITITAALGYDSYLVMRHGTNPIIENTVESSYSNPDIKVVSGNKLGCYFCNDVTAPGNSLRDRTLDQQCTVTRPGVSTIASSLAVELLMSISQHPNGHAAAAFYSTDSIKSDIEAANSVLGNVPHTIRGYIGSFEQITPVVERFEQCIACSRIVVNKFNDDGDTFLFKVFESSDYLEKVTGLQDLLQDLDNSEIWDLTDTDDE